MAKSGVVELKEIRRVMEELVGVMKKVDWRGGRQLDMRKKRKRLGEKRKMQ